MKKIEIVKTVSRSISEEYDYSIRTVRINGVMHLQMQGREHEIMRPTWSKGILMTCPDDIIIESIISDITESERYFHGYGDGCEIVENIPCELI